MPCSTTILASSTRKRLCETTLLAPGEMKRFTFDDIEPIVLCNYEGIFYVLDDDCTHAIASLSEGRLEDGLLICPVHGGSFDVASGVPRKLPCRRPLKTWPVEVIDGIIWIKTGE